MAEKETEYQITAGHRLRVARNHTLGAVCDVCGFQLRSALSHSGSGIVSQLRYESSAEWAEAPKRLPTCKEVRNAQLRKHMA